MQLLKAGLGIEASGGSTWGSATENQNQSGASSTSNQYSTGQRSLQDLLSQAFASMLPGISSGTLSPNVKAQKNQAGDSINRTYAGLGDRMNRFLAGRGYGQSGAVGDAALKTELGRAGALSKNESDFAKVQDDQNNQFLSQALTAAFASMGTNVDWSSLLKDQKDTSQSGFGVKVGI